jgi:hypothetical protein
MVVDEDVLPWVMDNLQRLRWQADAGIADVGRAIEQWATTAAEEDLDLVVSMCIGLSLVAGQIIAMIVRMLKPDPQAQGDVVLKAGQPWEPGKIVDYAAQEIVEVQDGKD